MLVLCNQAFTNDTFMQWVNDKAGLLLQYKLRERPKFTFMGGLDIFWTCGQGYQEKFNCLGGGSGFLQHYTHGKNNFPQKTQNTFLRVLGSFCPLCVLGRTSMWRGTAVNFQGPGEGSGSFRLALTSFFSCLWMKKNPVPLPGRKFWTY